MQNLALDLTQSAPLLTLLGVGLLLMLADAFRLRGLLPVLAGAGLLVSAALAWPGGPIHAAQAKLFFSDMMLYGGATSLVHVFLCVIAALSLFFVGPYMRRMQNDVGEAFALMVMAVIGMIMLASANDLVIVFIGLEIMSVSLYVLAALFKRDARSNESGFKYFLLGAFASGFLLYGIALLYGLAGTTQLNEIALKVFSDDPSASITQNVLFYPAVGLMLVGFLFKLAAFPFHAWTPDVYTGAPTPIAGFMATGSKLAAFVAISMFVLHALPMQSSPVLGNAKGQTLIAICALASMIYGNAVALRQRNLKRILAYSSISHSGYVLLGVASGPEGYMNVIFYAVVYSLMTLGAFGVISALERKGKLLELNDLRGLGKEQPLLAGLLSVFMLSLAGVPPLAGFMAKYLIFGSAIQSGIASGSNLLIICAVVGILASVMGAFYYLRVIGAMYFRPKPEVAEATAENPEGGFEATVHWSPIVGALVLGVLVLAVGVYPSLLFDPISTFYAADGYLTYFLR